MGTGNVSGEFSPENVPRSAQVKLFTLLRDVPVSRVSEMWQLQANTFTHQSRP